MKILYINTAAADASLSLVRSEQVLQAVSAPQFRLGDKEKLRIYLVDGAGAFDSLSGSGSVTLKLGLGNKGAAPTGGTFVLADSTDQTSALNYNCTASELQTALNALNSGAGPFSGTVTVTGTNPGFLITWASNGAHPNLTLYTNNLTPSSGVSIAELQTGDGSTAEKQSIYLAQSPVIFRESWTGIANGWEGQLDCATFEARDYLEGLASASIYLEIEVTDGSGNRVTRQQIQTTLHGEVIAEDALAPVGLPTYLNEAQSRAAFVQNKSGLTGLTGGTGTDLDGIATANGAVSAGEIVAVTLSDAVSFYQLQSGTDSEDSPTVIRPDDYASSTNEVIWKRLAVIGAVHGEYEAITITGAGNDDITLTEGREHKEINVDITDAYNSSPFDATLSLKDTNAKAGDVIELRGRATAPGDGTLKVYDQSTGGTLLTTFEAQGAITGGYAYFFARWIFDGSNWEEFTARFEDA